MSGKCDDSLVFTSGTTDMEWYSVTLNSASKNSKPATASPVVSNSEKPNLRSSTTLSLGDYFMENGELIKSHGISWIVAALLIVADMAGAGIVALPSAIIKCSFYPGIAIISVMAVLAMLSAILLGKAWVILLEMYPFYRTHCRKPYAEIGYNACGLKMRLFVSVILNFTQFGVSTTFLLLVARTATHLLLSVFSWRVNYCFVILAVAATLMPLVMLKSPKDFWQVIVFSTMSTFGAVALICAGTVADLPECAGRALFPPVDATKNLMALGIFLFTFGGHAILPTVQHDMKRPNEFTKSSVLAFTLIALMTLTVVVLAGVTYGDSLRGTVIESIQTKWIQQLINLMIIAHCFLCFPLMINPVNQEFEELLGISQSFSTSRVLLRLTVMCAITFTAVSVPSFEELMGLFGGSTITMTSMVLPAVFYLYLSAKQKSAFFDKRFFEQSQAPEEFSLSTLRETNTKKKEKNKYMVNMSEIGVNEAEEDDQLSISFSRVLKVSDKRALLFCGMMCTIGVIAGITATAMSVNSILKLSSADLKPCYFQLFQPAQHLSSATTTIVASLPSNGSLEQLTAFIDNAAITSALGEDDEKGVSSASGAPIRYVNCCGRFQNISIGGRPEVCTLPDLKFYVTG